MTLAFKTKWPKHMGEWAGKPTYFVEKTTNCLKDVLGGYLQAKYKPESYDFIASLNLGKKLHTFREDRFDRWGHGANLHFAINNRSPDYFQFAPVVKCVSVQKIEIKHADDDGFPWAEPVVYIDDKWFIEVDQLATNDGFESVEQFFAWFNTDFTGKIIHWTDFKY